MKSIARIGFAVLLVLTLSSVAWMLMTTRFMSYDDEGYLLLTYRNFSAGHVLYGEIFTQYGPVPYLYHRVLGWLTGEPLTHLAGRVITCVHWVLASILCGVTAWKLTRSTITALSATRDSYNSTDMSVPLVAGLL